MPDIDPIYKTKDGQQVTKRQLLESGYSEDRITKGLSNGILAQIGDTEARGQTFRTKDGQVVDYEQLINSGYSEERINKGIQNGILTASDIEKKNLSKPTGMPLSTGTESMPSPTLPLATSPFDYKRQQETGGLAEASTELRTERYFHNAPKESDLISEVKKYIPADDAALSQSILNGDLNSIKKAKEDYISKIDKQKQDIKNSLQGGQDEFSGISKSVQLQPQLDALDKDKENVEGIFNQFAQHSAVSNRMRLVQEEGTEQGLSDGILAKEIGHQIEKEILPTKDFNKRESVYNNAKAYPLFKKAIDDGQITDPDVIKRVNSDAFQEIRNRELYVKENIDYDREKSGLSAMMQTISLKANDLISKGLTEKNPDLIKQGNELINKYNVLKSKDDKLLERYPDVGIAQGNQIVSDRISKMGIRGFINSDAIKAAIATEENETGTFLKQYGKFIDYVKPAMLPKGGLVENLGLGIEQIGNELFGGSDLQEIARTYNPSLKTTSFSGGQPTKIAYDNNGKAYREMPNENYNTWDFNNSMRVIGHGLPALIEFVILEKGIGAVAGLAGEVSASAITNLAKLGSKITKAPITAEEIATAREALQFSKGLENTTGLTGAMYWTSYEQNRQLADELVDGDSGKDEFKKNVLANVLTLVSAGAFRAVGFSPAQTVQKAFSKGILPDALKIIEKQGLEGLGKQEVAEGFFKDVVLPKATAIVKSLGVSVKGGIKGAEAVVLDKNLQGLLASMVNPEKGELPSFKEDTDMAISQILLMTVAGLPGLVNAKTKSTLTKDAMYEAGLRHPQFEGLINKGVENGRYSQEQANEMISVLKTIGEESYKVQGETTKDGLPLTVKQKRDLAFNNFKIRAAKMLEEKGHNVDAESVKTETQAENETILSNSRFEPVVVDENGDVSEQKTVELTPEEIIIQEAGKKKLIGPFNDLVKADPKLAEDVLLDYAKQKYAISDNGEILEEGGREITNKEVDNAVNKKFPNKESVINAITKPKTQTNEEAKTNEANQTEVLTPPVSSVDALKDVESTKRKKSKEEFDKISGVRTTLVGSTARNEAKEGSDIDIVLEGMPHQNKDKLNSEERQENSNYAYDKLKHLAESGTITEFELLPNGFGLSFKFNGHTFQVVPNPKAPKQSLPKPVSSVEGGEVKLENADPNNDFANETNLMFNIKVKDEVIGDVDIEKNNNGNIISNIVLNDEHKGKGYGKNVYRQLNEQSINETGSPLHSSSEKMRSEDANNVWKSLVKSGEAELLSDGIYKFKEQSQPKGEAAKQPATKKESDEKVSNPPKEKPADEGKVTEAGKAAEEGTGGGEKEPPISEPPKGTRIHFERPATELSHRGLQDVANEFSLPDVETRDRKSDVQLRQDATNTANDWAEKGVYGKNVEKLVQKAESGEILTDEQRIILEGHLANLSKELRDVPDKKSAEFDAKLAEIKRLKDAGEKTRSETGAALRIPIGGSRPKDMADFLVEEMDVSGTDKLTEKQKETAVKEFEDISEAKKKYDEKIAGLEAENARLRAEQEVKNIRSKKGKEAKKDYAAERKEIVGDILLKLSKARGESASFLGAAELASIAPDVLRLVKNVAADLTLKLAEVIDRVHDILKDGIPDIEKRNIHDIISGQYNEKKRTRNELATRMVDLKTEVALINKLDALERGEEPKSEKKKIERNKEITDLRKKIKDFEGKKTAESNRIKAEEKAAEKAKSDAIKEEEKFIREFEKEKESNAKKAAKAKVDAAKKLATDLENKTKPESLLASMKTRMANEIKEIQEQIRTGNFEKAVAPKQSIPLDKEAIDLRDNLIKLRQQRELRLLLQQRQNEGRRERALRTVAEVANVPRTLMTIADFSGLLRQNLFFSVGHPLMTAKALPGMFKSFTSQKVYDAWFADLKESPRYEAIKESKLAIADSLSHDLTQREEAFMSTLAEKIPLIGQTLKVQGKTVVPGLNIVKGSERSYTMLLNKMRVDMFNYFSDSMEKRGLTMENSQKQYKAMAEYINNATGRSDFGETLNRVSPILNSVFFSPRLIASRINMLTYWAQPRFWNTLPREVKVDYFRNWISLLAVGGTVMALSQLGGATVEDDPRSSDFGKIKDGDTRWDIWGGAQPYIRVLAQVVSGKRKSTNTGKIYSLNGDDLFGETRGGVVADFFRNKLAPVPGAAVDILSGRTSIGDKIVYQYGGAGKKEISIDEYIKQRILPMTITGTEEAMKDQGVKALFTVGIPNVFGVGTQTYQSKKK